VATRAGGAGCRPIALHRPGFFQNSQKVFPQKKISLFLKKCFFSSLLTFQKRKYPPVLTGGYFYQVDINSCVCHFLYFEKVFFQKLPKFFPKVNIFSKFEKTHFANHFFVLHGFK